MKLWRDFWSLAHPYWKGPDRVRGFLLLCGSLAFALGMIYFQYLFTIWNQEFYDALERADFAAFYRALLKFVWVGAGLALVTMYNFYLAQLLRMRWRGWLTEYFLDRWLKGQVYYFWHLSEAEGDNPDQRIAEDIKEFIDLTVYLILGIFRNTITLATFSVILWQLSGVVSFTVGNSNITVPGYVMIVCVLYALAGSLFTHWLGKVLVPLHFDQQKFEADFRFGLVRIRENAESIALIKGERAEKFYLLRHFENVLKNFKSLIDKQKQLTFTTTSYDLLATVFPILISAPRYLAKEITLGQVFQISTTFTQVKGALSYFIDAYTMITQWLAVIQRLRGFEQSAESALVLRSNIPPHEGASLIAKGLTLKLPNTANLLEGLDLEIFPGESVLLMGPSGRGKSTLLRAFNQLWPHYIGKLSLPDKARVLVIPQKPYLPLGTLRAVLFYPSPYVDPSDQKVTPLLELTRLSHLNPRLDEVQNWSQILSPGEQQRVAFLRCFLHQPDWIFLDEATSALDQEIEEHLYQELKRRLPKAAIISISHRLSLKSYHQKLIQL